MLAVILAKSDYLYTANTIYSKLEKMDDIFEKEAYVLSYVKCALLRNEDLNDFVINGIAASVYENTNGYEIYFDDYKLTIDVYDKQIVDYNIKAY